MAIDTRVPSSRTRGPSRAAAPSSDTPRASAKSALMAQPDELLLKQLVGLDRASLVAFSSVSRDARALANDDSLWRRPYEAACGPADDVTGSLHAAFVTAMRWMGIGEMRVAPQRFTQASEVKRGDPTVARSVILLHPHLLQNTSAALRDDATFVHSVARRDGSAFSHASERLRDDEGTLAIAIQTYPDAFRSAGPIQRANKPLFLEATRLRKTVSLLASAEPALRDDVEAVRASLQNDPQTIRDAGPTVRMDRPLVLEAVGLQGRALARVDMTFRDDAGVCLAAIASDPSSVIDASARLRADKAFMLQALAVDARCFSGASDALKLDPDVRAAAGKPALAQ